MIFEVTFLSLAVFIWLQLNYAVNKFFEQQFILKNNNKFLQAKYP